MFLCADEERSQAFNTIEIYSQLQNFQRKRKVSERKFSCFDFGATTF